MIVRPCYRSVGTLVIALVVALALAACPAPPPPKVTLTNIPGDAISPKVFIQIKPPNNPAWGLAPRVVGVCKSPKADCGNSVTWKWIGPYNSADSVRIEAKNGQPNCFDPVDLTQGSSMVTRVVKAGCPLGTVWEYNVTCEESGNPCLPTLDPKVHVQG